MPDSRGTRAKRPSGKRDTIKVGSKTMYEKRTSTSRFMEIDEKGRSLMKSDRRVKAKTETKSGVGDTGDRRTRSTKRPRRPSEPHASVD